MVSMVTDILSTPWLFDDDLESDMSFGPTSIEALRDVRGGGTCKKCPSGLMGDVCSINSKFSTLSSPLNGVLATVPTRYLLLAVSRKKLLTAGIKLPRAV